MCFYLFCLIYNLQLTLLVMPPELPNAHRPEVRVTDSRGAKVIHHFQTMEFERFPI